MRLRVAAAIAVAMFAFGTLCAAEDITLGTWKLNTAKSRFEPPTQQKYDTITTQSSGDNVQMTLDGSDADGKPIHTKWVGKYDGKDYPIIGDPAYNMRAYKMVNANTFEVTSKNGSQSNKNQIAYSPDGKTRTVTVKGKDAKGKNISQTAVYDKQ